MPFCDICDEHYFEYSGTLYSNVKHQCPPIFECSETGDGCDWHQVRAVDYQYAAEKIAQEWDEYDAEGPQERTILVRKRGEERCKKFEVSFEHCIDYSAEECE